MNQPPQTSKRIVSKGEYIANLADKMYVYAVGGLGGLLCLLCLVSIGILFYELREIHTSEFPLFVVLVLVMAGGFGFVFPRVKQAIQAANEIDTGIPLTRANTADLPAPESLVRASTEPAQEQEAVLLRAASEAQERHEEQLVRASAEQQ